LYIRTLPMVAHRFTFTPGKTVSTVVVMGGFNDWSRTALPLSDNDGDGTWERTVYLKPDRHEYKFVVDGEELIDPENPVFVSNNIGGWNSILDLTRYREAPPGQFQKVFAKGSKLTFRFLPPEDKALPAQTWVSFNNQPLHPDQVDPQPDGSVTVNTRGLTSGTLRIMALDARGRAIPENITLLKAGNPLSPDNAPEDWHFTVLYNLMIDRFYNGNRENDRPIADPRLPELANFMGGDLAGIRQKIDSGYFNRLGINTIWISPVQRQPDSAYAESIEPHRVYSGYHGYWPVLPRTIDPRFGTETELRDLVDTAHQHGIRVILDFVTNHVHQNHVYYRDHPEWFGSVRLPDGTLNIRNWSEETRLTTWFDTFLPSFDYPHNPEAIEQVVADALWWLETYRLDGFRQDAVKHVPHEFWKTLTREMKSRFPNRHYYQIGETFGSDELILSYVNPAELDAQFNFSIYFNARTHFVADSTDFAPLMDVLQTNLNVMGPTHLMGNITSSHDQLRFMGLADGQVAFSDDGTRRSFEDPPGPVRHASSYRKLAAFHALDMALPGVPVIYYGDEMGLMGAGDPGNRRPLRFGPDRSPEEKALAEAVSRLSHLRQTRPALALGDLIPVLADGSTMAFLKTYFDDRILVVFHQSPKEETVKLKLPVEGSRLVNLITGEEISLADGRTRLTLPPYSFRYLEVK
ncbi:MAG: alpha-amylase family glycosyl hydrolase, partial [Fidelibacterota bacterium]